jgi:type III pantothenate kinase
LKLLIDIGNTRTKWVLSESNEFLADVSGILNEDIERSDLAKLAANVNLVLVANVAGKVMEKRLQAILKHCSAAIHFVQSTDASCGITNLYEQPNRLGVDRWLSLIAAYELRKTSCLVVNAGTAVTIDSLVVSTQDYTGQFIGGVITPGLHLMQLVLNTHTAQLPKVHGALEPFPKNTHDAIHTGCMIAVLGAIQLQWQQLYDVVKTPPQLCISGGDAQAIFKNLPANLVKHSIIVDNLVLRGLMRLEREMA